jgi:hypothetical protein
VLLRHSRLAATAAALLLCAATTASAQITLWEQTWKPAGDGSLNLSSTSCSPLSGNTKLHTTSDVHFDQPVHITSITIYETEGNVAAATQAYLWIAPKTGPLPTVPNSDLNNAANLKSITIGSETKGASFARTVTVSGLDVNLPAGDYWISLTPRHSRGIFPYTVHIETDGPVVGDPTCVIEACTVNSNWLYPLNPYKPDYSIKVMGDYPVATLPSSWARVKAIYR